MKLNEQQIRRIVRVELLKERARQKQPGKPISYPYHVSNKTASGKYKFGCHEYYDLYDKNDKRIRTYSFLINSKKTCKQLKDAEIKRQQKKRISYAIKQAGLANPRRNQVKATESDMSYYPRLFETFLSDMKNDPAFKKAKKYTRQICYWLGGQIVEFLSFSSIASLIKMKAYGKATTALISKIINVLPQARGIKLALKGLSYSKAAWKWMSGPVAKFFAKIAIGKGVSKLVFAKIAKKLDKLLGVHNPVTIWKNKLNDFIEKAKTAFVGTASSVIGYAEETDREAYCRKKHPRGSASTLRKCLNSKEPVPKQKKSKNKGRQCAVYDGGKCVGYF